MVNKSDLGNYFGQIRVYSLIDLVLMLFAFKFSSLELLGAIFLHLSFIFYLEYRHKHKYRNEFPSIIWVVLLIIGIFLYAKLAVLGFIITSYLYAEKKRKTLSPFSSIFRGGQIYFLLAGILGFTSGYAIFAGILIFFRNFAGDLRDIEKDRKEKMRTLPVILGLKRDVKNIHLLALFLTSFVWWYISGISVIWIILIFIIQIATYYLTPR